MALRGMAGELARGTAGIWKAVADVVDPKPPAPPAAGAANEPRPEHAATIDVDAGQMLVPIDAWTRILEQVGHVHEAGQQLAAARERAARAETENEFLKAQLRELKAGRPARPPAAPAASAPTAPAGAAAPNGMVTPAVGGARLRRAREAASRWIGPR